MMSQDSGVEELNKSGVIRGMLECTICMEPCASPIHACVKNGHLICGLCMDKLEEQAKVPCCPLCKSWKIEVNAFAERESRRNEMKGVCIHNDIGCKGIFLCFELRKHVKICDYRLVKCTYSLARTDVNKEGGGCGNFLAPAEMPRHLIEVHGKPFQIHIPNEVYTLHLPSAYDPEDPAAANDWENKGSHHYRLIKFDERYFRLHSVTKNNMFCWWISIFGGEKDAEQYKYRTEILWKSEAVKKKNMACVWEVPVMPYNGYQIYSVHNGNYAMVHGSTATAAAEKTDKGVRLLSVKIIISKNTSEESKDEGAEESSKKSSEKSEGEEAKDEESSTNWHKRLRGVRSEGAGPKAKASTTGTVKNKKGKKGKTGK